MAYIDQFLTWAAKYNINVFIDIHCQIGSQNGFDNSGQATRIEWLSNKTSYPPGLVSFAHWPVRSANWLGEFNTVNLTYDVINYAHIQHSLDTIQIIVDLYKNNPAVIGLEPVNEPFEQSPVPVLKQFYWDGYLIVKESAPHWKYIMHDSFRFSRDIWGGFMADCPDRILDTHIYSAWSNPGPRDAFFHTACKSHQGLAEMEIAFGPVIVGEWSIATDQCAMWQNGFNDDIPGYPKMPCKYIDCSQNETYLGPDQPGVPLNKTKPLQGPYGTGSSGPIYGMCPVGRDWFVQSNDPMFFEGDFLNMPPKAPPSLNDNQVVMRGFAEKLLHSYSYTHGNVFWNFRTELYEPRWSFPDAVKAGYMPTGDLNTGMMLATCDNFPPNGTFVCVCKEGQSHADIANGFFYAITLLKDETPQSLGINLTTPSWERDASILFQHVYERNRLSGVTCDFNGVATLKWLNVTAPDRFPVIPQNTATEVSWYVIFGLAIVAVLFVAWTGILQRQQRGSGEVTGPAEETTSLMK